MIQLLSRMVPGLCLLLCMSLLLLQQPHVVSGSTTTTTTISKRSSVRGGQKNSSIRYLQTDDADADTNDPSETTPTPDPIVVHLVPFQVSVEGSAVQDEDVDAALEKYLFRELSIAFPPIAAVLLAHETGARRRRRRRRRHLGLTHSTYFSAGAGIFLDPDTVPSEKDLQKAQQAALEDLLELQKFVNLEGYYWILDPVVIGEVEFFEEEEELELAISGVQKGTSVSGDNNEDKSKIVSIVMLAAGGCLVVLALCLATRKKNYREKVDPDSYRLESRVVTPTAAKVDMCGNIQTRVPDHLPPRRARSQVSSQGMELTSEGVMIEVGFGERVGYGENFRIF